MKFQDYRLDLDIEKNILEKGKDQPYCWQENNLNVPIKVFQCFRSEGKLVLQSTYGHAHL